MKFLLATKQNMTQVFDETGRVRPATLVSTGPLTVVQVKTAEKDGYAAVQVGFGTRPEKHVSKAVKGHTKGAAFRMLKEFRPKNAKDVETMKAGDTFDVSSLSVGDTVTVSALSKGKGFQGVIKRHGFHGGPRSHGQKHSERAPGSIGTAGIQRTIKGMRMGGRMGGDRITIKNLKVLAVDRENGMMLISGAIPGRRGTYVEIKG
jgi:large subunit ribosomal protein L3